jgi:hypothetical protein
MDKRFWIAGVIASVLLFALGFLVHGLILTPDYMNHKQIFRTEEAAMANMPWMTLAHVIMGFAFVWIYSKGVNDRGSWMSQGIRFGIAAVLLVTVPWYLIYYSVQPWEFATTAKQIALDGITLIIIAIATAYIYKPRDTPNR